MKHTKKTTVVTTLLTLLMLVTLSCREQSILPENIDSTAASFIHTYFPNATVHLIIKKGYDYDVTLSDHTKIDFDRNMDWEEIDCTHSTYYTEVPSALIPDKIFNYLQQYHEGRRVVKLSKSNKKWEVELDNGLEIDFDKNMNVIEID